MQIDVDRLKKIYIQFGDNISREIFINRLIYSISEDIRWLFKNLEYVGDGGFLRQLEKCSAEGEMVIFGAGARGKALYNITEKYPWKCYVDNSPFEKEIQGLPVIECGEFLKRYNNEFVFVTPKRDNEEIYGQLITAGIPASRIVNMVKSENEIIKAQYFDLEYLEPAEKEIFLDVGGYDGMTSVYFSQWAKKDYISYIFEPDISNIEKCRENMRRYHVNHKIIEKGAWDQETILKFQADGNVGSQISSQGETTIHATTIDKECEGEKVSFIKMDIEGAELRAIMGARQTIIDNRPKLAISVYHRPEDIWEIPDIILKFNPHYKLFLRHYTFSESDTVLYAIPL